MGTAFPLDQSVLPRLRRICEINHILSEICKAGISVGRSIHRREITSTTTSFPISPPKPGVVKRRPEPKCRLPPLLRACGCSAEPL